MSKVLHPESCSCGAHDEALDPSRRAFIPRVSWLVAALTGGPFIGRALALIVITLALLPNAQAQNTAEINLFFYGAKTRLTKKQLTRLDSLMSTVDRSQIIGITLVGHTDSIFGRASNLPLAEERAQSVKKLLVQRNIPDSLITTVPFNAPDPVKEGLHPKGPTRNRRVYLRIESRPVILPGAVE